MVSVPRGLAGGGSGAETPSHDASAEDWLRCVASTRLLRNDVLDLARELPARAPELVAKAQELHGPQVATVLAFACAVRAFAIPHAALLALIPEVDDLGHAIALMHHGDLDPVALALSRGAGAAVG